MSNVAVVYKSKYGSTKQYAQWIAEALDAPLFEASEVRPRQLMEYDMVVYGGGLYAGGINGVELVTKNPCKSLTVFTVGLADPNNTDYSAVLKKNFPKDMLPKTKIFHLRGGIDYGKLGFVHKGMMAVFKKATAKQDVSELSGEAKALVETNGENADFTDKGSIAPIVAFISEELGGSYVGKD